VAGRKGDVARGELLASACRRHGGKDILLDTGKVLSTSMLHFCSTLETFCLGKRWLREAYLHRCEGERLPLHLGTGIYVRCNYVYL
jgi:hypothetical protein